MSYLINLICTSCEKNFECGKIQTFCPECQSPLFSIYDLDRAKEELDRENFHSRPRGMWRWHELLPVFYAHNQVTLGEGDTPLLRLHHLGSALGLHNLFIKDESLNPTGSFKARGLSAAVSKAKELGITKLIIPTAGNAGGALAAYSARAKIEACVYMPQDTPVANIKESRIAGASVELIDGLISEAAGMAGIKAKNEGWFDVSTFKEPYRVEGKKVMGYELAEHFHWELPDVIIYPTGGGTGLIGMWKAFAELEKLGWLEKNSFPRLVSVQSSGCAPIVKAFEQGAEFSDYWPDAHTVASGLRVPKSFADQLILRYIRNSNGTAISVNDEEIIKAQEELATCEGIFAAPEGAATLAGLNTLIDQKWTSPEERIVLFNTGSGLKYIN